MPPPLEGAILSAKSGTFTRTRLDSSRLRTVQFVDVYTVALLEHHFHTFFDEGPSELKQVGSGDVESSEAFNGLQPFCPPS